MEIFKPIEQRHLIFVTFVVPSPHAMRAASGATAAPIRVANSTSERNNRLQVILIRRNDSRTRRTGRNIEIYTMTKRRVDMHTNRKIP